MHRFLIALSALVLPITEPAIHSDVGTDKVQVFILAGQSNMEGKGSRDPLVWQLSQEAYRDRYAHLVQGGDPEAFTKVVVRTTRAGETQYPWSVRDDVFIDFLGRRGGLTFGYGQPSKGLGPELNFGHALGDHLDAPVLIVKTAWGGKSLGCDFLSPSANDLTAADYARIAAEETARDKAHDERKGNAPRAAKTAKEIEARYGKNYQEMIEIVRANLEHMGERFPELKGREAELGGFVWFQGWNDQFHDDWPSDYEANMRTFVQDVRRDLRAPKLPFVIGQVGFDGSNEPVFKNDGSPNPRTLIQAAQAQVGGDKKLAPIVMVETAHLWDQEAHAIYQGEGGWQADPELWRHFGNDRPYHYLGSPWFFAQAGSAFGAAMIELID
jgi:hypothetical protein